MNAYSEWYDLIEFQLNIADRWLERGNKTEDVFAKFFFYYTGFNALYFLWSKINNLPETNEGKHIENMLGKFDEIKCQNILDKLSNSIDYFCKRSPIQRMGRRNIKDQKEGKEDEGRKWKNRLKDQELKASTRINALGQLIYLVRSNLVHGSKAESGDDLEIIKNSMEPLRLLLTEALSVTKQQQEK